MATRNTKKAPAKKKNEVAPVDQTNNLPVTADAYNDFLGEGFENQTQDDIAIPFINLLQSMSPEVQDGGIDGAKPGMLINSVTQELYSEIEFVPAFSKHVFVEWVPRDQGGGIVATHNVDSELVRKVRVEQEFGKYRTPEGNDLIETFYLFGVASEDGNPLGMAVIAFTSTKIKSYKAAMTRLRTFTIPQKDGRRVSPPMYAHLLKLSTKTQKNSKGTFYVPALTPAIENDVSKSLLPTSDIHFQMARECYDLVKEGKAQEDISTAETRTKEATEDPEDDMPF